MAYSLISDWAALQADLFFLQYGHSWEKKKNRWLVISHLSSVLLILSWAFSRAAYSRPFKTLCNNAFNGSFSSSVSPAPTVSGSVSPWWRIWPHLWSKSAIVLGSALKPCLPSVWMECPWPFSLRAKLSAAFPDPQPVPGQTPLRIRRIDFRFCTHGDTSGSLLQKTVTPHFLRKCGVNLCLSVTVSTHPAIEWRASRPATGWAARRSGTRRCFPGGSGACREGAQPGGGLCPVCSPWSGAPCRLWSALPWASHTTGASTCRQARL